MTAEIMQYIDERFDRLEKMTLIGGKAVLNVKEAAIYTCKNIKTIYNLVNKRKIPHYKHEGKLYFKKAELDEWLTENRIKTSKEIDIEATTYVATH